MEQDRSKGSWKREPLITTARGDRMTEDAAMWIVFWSLLGMVIVGVLLPILMPGLVRYIDRNVLGTGKDGPKGHSH
jgi:hypothetical protein